MDSTRSIARWVRLSGEPDELASFEWVKARLEEYGFETELTHHRAYISLPGPAVLRVAGHDREVTGISHAFATSTPTGGLSGRLVDARSADAAGAADAPSADACTLPSTATWPPFVAFAPPPSVASTSPPTSMTLPSP